MLLVTVVGLLSCVVAGLTSVKCPQSLSALAGTGTRCERILDRNMSVAAPLIGLLLCLVVELVLVSR